MDWEIQLVTVYVMVCGAWEQGTKFTVQRFSNHNVYVFSDQEAMTLYLFGVTTGLKSIRQIYDYGDRHLREWFPTLGEYKSFVYRLNKISPAFAALCESWVVDKERLDTSTFQNWVVDSLPIILAGPKRSNKAKIASEIADKGFCASKDLYFYGVKLHCVGLLRESTLPNLSFIGLAQASSNDHVMFEQVSEALTPGRVFADKAYKDKDHCEHLSTRQITLLTPIKKTKGSFSLPSPETFSTWVSHVRQPIESLFSWITAKTDIQSASRVRSFSGLLTHVFGKLAAAIVFRTHFHSI